MRNLVMVFMVLSVCLSALAYTPGGPRARVSPRQSPNQSGSQVGQSPADKQRIADMGIAYLSGPFKQRAEALLSRDGKDGARYRGDMKHLWRAYINANPGMFPIMVNGGQHPEVPKLVPSGAIVPSSQEAFVAWTNEIENALIKEEALFCQREGDQRKADELQAQLDRKEGFAPLKLPCAAGCEYPVDSDDGRAIMAALGSYYAQYGDNSGREDFAKKLETAQKTYSGGVIRVFHTELPKDWPGASEKEELCIMACIYNGRDVSNLVVCCSTPRAPRKSQRELVVRRRIDDAIQTIPDDAARMAVVSLKGNSFTWETDVTKYDDEVDVQGAARGAYDRGHIERTFSFMVDPEPQMRANGSLAFSQEGYKWIMENERPLILAYEDAQVMDYLEKRRKDLWPRVKLAREKAEKEAAEAAEAERKRVEAIRERRAKVKSQYQSVIERAARPESRSERFASAIDFAKNAISMAERDGIPTSWFYCVAKLSQLGITSEQLTCEAQFDAGGIASTIDKTIRKKMALPTSANATFMFVVDPSDYDVKQEQPTSAWVHVLVTIGDEWEFCGRLGLTRVKDRWTIDNWQGSIWEDERTND